MSAGLRELLTHGRRTIRAIESLAGVAEGYRQALDYRSGRFRSGAMLRELHRKRSSTDARRTYEAAICHITRMLMEWQRLAAQLDPTEHQQLLRTGGGPRTLFRLLQGTSLPKNPTQAQRLRFCSVREVDHLQDILGRVANELTSLEQTLHAQNNPYR